MSVADARAVMPVAWMPDDRRLLVELFSGKRVVALGLLDTVAAVSTGDAHPVAPPLCAPGTAPPLPLLMVAGRFLPDGSLAALTCPPAAGGAATVSAATVSAYDVLGSAARRPLMAALPFPNTVGRLNALALSPDGTAGLGVTTPTPSDHPQHARQHLALERWRSRSAASRGRVRGVAAELATISFSSQNP